MMTLLILPAKIEPTMAHHDFMSASLFLYIGNWVEVPINLLIIPIRIVGSNSVRIAMDNPNEPIKRSVFTLSLNTSTTMTICSPYDLIAVTSILLWSWGNRAALPPHAQIKEIRSAPNLLCYLNISDNRFQPCLIWKDFNLHVPTIPYGMNNTNTI